MNGEQLFNRLLKLWGTDGAPRCRILICSDKTIPTDSEGLYICNIISKKHWIVVYKTADGTLEFFDPTGAVELRLLDVLLKDRTMNGKAYAVNNVKLQGENSNDCGYFCLLYTILRLKMQCSMFDSIYSLYDCRAYVKRIGLCKQHV